MGRREACDQMYPQAQRSSKASSLTVASRTRSDAQLGSLNSRLRGHGCGICLRRAMGGVRALVPLDAARTFRYRQAARTAVVASATQGPIAIVCRPVECCANADEESVCDQTSVCVPCSEQMQRDIEAGVREVGMVAGRVSQEPWRRPPLKRAEERLTRKGPVATERCRPRELETLLRFFRQRVLGRNVDRHGAGVVERPL
jgi:hypothetical protein